MVVLLCPEVFHVKRVPWCHILVSPKVVAPPQAFLNCEYAIISLELPAKHGSQRS
jgi:hypothetical protein